MRWKILKPRVRSVSYTKTTTIGPDGKVVRETTTLNDGGECETHAEVKAMQRYMDRITKVMDQLGGLLKD
jgi:hypothetical protein